MATVAPPPSKRQKVAITTKAQAKEDANVIPDDLGSIRIQFVDQATGKFAGVPVNVPVADATVRNLESLLNTLQSNVGGP